MATYFLAENFFDGRQFPDHTITGEDETTGYEGWRVATARRHPRNYYTPQTANAARYIEAACDRVRSADTFILDRNHNLDGKTLRIWASNQAAFTTYNEVVNVTIPASTYYANALTAGHPVRTEEGAVVIRFTATAAKYWRIEMDAPGANEKQRVGGAWLGLAWSPNIAPLPWGDEIVELQRPELGFGIPSAFHRYGRTASVRMMLKDEAEWAAARYQLHSLFHRGRAMWFMPDSTYGERSWLAYSQAGGGAAFTNRSRGRDLTVSLSEYQPRLPVT